MSLNSQSRAAARVIVADDDAWNSAAVDMSVDLPEAPSPSIDWNACGRGFLCACGSAAVSHVGCVVAPTLAFMGAAGGASISALSLGASAVLTVAGAGAWYALRGRHANPLERRLTFSGMAAGAVMVLGLHFSGATGHHGHDDDAALSWYRQQSATMQTQIRESAGFLKMSLPEYVRQICGPVIPPAQSAGEPQKIALPGLDKL